MRTLTGTGTLLRLALRRERLRLPLWILGIIGLVYTNASSFPELFPTEADRQARAALMQTPATIALTGPGHGLQDYTYGAMVANEGLSFTAVLLALLCIFLVTRHTRAEEESGRAELVRAAPVGRHAATASALLLALLACAVVGALLVIVLPASPSALPVGDSILFAVALGSVGLVFAAVAALTSQITGFTRAASGLAGVVLGTSYMLRAIGDLGDGTLSWLSPIGWAQATRPYVDGRWWPLAIALVVAIDLVMVAGLLSTRRDVGAGLLTGRPARAEAHPRLASPLALALRLQRTGLIGWTAAIAVFSVVYGSVVGDVERFAADNEMVREFLRVAGQDDFVSAFLASILQILALLAAGFAIQSTLRLRGEEVAGRVEPLLATAVGRTRWAASHLVVAGAGSVVLLLVAGLLLGATTAVSLGDASWIGRLAGAALAHVPAVWLTIGVAVALFGIVPRAAIAAWAVLVYGMVIGLFGPLLPLPDWALEASPFAQIPALPSEELTLVPLAILLAVSAAFVGGGLAAFRQRNLLTS